MEYNNSPPRQLGSAITVTTDIIRSEARLMTNLSDRKDGLKRGGIEQGRQEGVTATNGSKRGSTTVLSIRGVEGNHEPCASPVVHDKRTQKVLPPVGLQCGFEESPEWRQHYDPSSKPGKTEGSYLADNQNRVSPDQSLIHTKNFSTETIITAKTLSDPSSINTIELGAKKPLRLPHPRSRQSLLKAGNLRLKQLIRPKQKTYFRTQPVAEAEAETEQDTAGQPQNPNLTASKKDLPRKGSKSRLERIVKGEAIRSKKAIRNSRSSTSIVDLNQVEARHGLEQYHRRTLSESWDEIFKSMGGFSGDNAHHNGVHSHSTGVSVTKPAWPASSTSPSKYETNESRNVSLALPPLPGPRTSSITAMVNASPTRQSFQVLVAELPAQSSPTRRSKPKSANQEDWPTEPDMNCLQVEESPRPHLRGARSSEGLSTFGPAANASQSTVALEAVEAEMNAGRPLSASTLTRLTQPFSINCTPPQPAKPPTDPPIRPLPELPEEFDRADAASRASSHHSSPTRHSRPIVPFRSPHPRNPSANPTGSNLTLRAMKSPKGHHHKHTSLGNKSPKKASSIRSARSVSVAGTSNPTHPRPEMASSVGDNANATGFNQYNLGRSQDLRGPAASETDQENDVVNSSGNAVAKSALRSSDVISSRSEHIKALKLRDLAKEKSTRARSRPHRSDLDDTIVTEKPCFVAEEETATTTARLSHFPLVPGRSSDISHDSNTGGSRPASRQDSVEGRPTDQSRRRSSNRTSPRTVRPIMNQSQIMVLAETNPDTQMFRASTPTASVRRTNSKTAESGIVVKGQKVRKHTSKTSVRPQVHPAAASKGIIGRKSNGEHTPPLSDLSSHSSDDDMGRTSRTRSSRGVSHIAARVKEDSDIESAPSKRAFAALARKEERKYFKEQLLLKKLKREGSELKLAMTLLSRGLEKLTTFVEADEELDGLGGHGLTDGEMEPARGLAESLGRLLSPEGWEGFDQGPSGHDDAGKEAKNDRDAGSRRAKNARANDARPISLVSRYSTVRNSMGESVIAGPPIKDDVIWDQVEGLNRAAMVSRASDT